MSFVNLQTVGAAFCAKAMRSKEKDYSIGIWDTAGSERYINNYVHCI